jgi:hypothetical protein
MARRRCRRSCYFVAVWVGIDAFANRYDLPGMGRSAPAGEDEVVITAGLLPGAVRRLLMGACSLAASRRNTPRRWPFSPLLLLLPFNASGIDARAGRQRVRPCSRRAADRDDRGDHPVRLDHHRRSGPDRARREDHVADPVGSGGMAGRRCC